MSVFWRYCQTNTTFMKKTGNLQNPISSVLRPKLPTVPGFENIGGSNPMDMYNYLAKLLRIYNTDDLHNFVPVNINSIAYIT